MTTDNKPFPEENALEAMLRDLAASRAKSFSPGFATRVAAMAASRANASSRQFEAFENLKSAFFGTAVAWAAACLVLFLWIHFHPNMNATVNPVVKTQSVEDALQNVTYKAMEEML